MQAQALRSRAAGARVEEKRRRGWVEWRDLCLLACEPGAGGDKRRGTAIRAVGSTSALPRVPWPWGGLIICGLVLFLARGRGAVAAGGFISCQPRRVFITNCQARSLILGVPHPHALWSLRDWVVSGNGGNVLGRKLGSPNRWKPVRFDRLPVKLVRPGSGLDRY